MLSQILCYVSISYCVLTLCFLVFSFFIKLKISTRQLSLAFTLLTLSLTIIAYHLTSNEGMDLSRYFVMLEEISQKDLSTIFETFIYKDSPLTTLIFYLVAKSGNYHILPAFATFVSMIFISSLIINIYKNKYNERDGFKDFSIILFFFFSFFVFITLMTGVRYIMAMSIMAYAIYRDVYYKKKNFATLIFYIIPIFIHPGILLVLFIRVMMLIFKKPNLFLLASGLLLFLMNSILSRFKGDFFMLISGKLTIYMSLSTSDIRNTIANILMLGILLFIDLYVYRSNKTNCGIADYIKKNNYALGISTNFTIFAVSICYMPMIIDRLFSLVLLLNLPNLCDYFKILSRSGKDKLWGYDYSLIKNATKIIFFIAGCGMFLYQAAGWKAWDLIF